ncbi:PH domain-containing protein, partial [Dysosmobacter welbionis]
QGHLGLVLADDVLVQHVLDLAGRGQLIRQVLQCAGRGVLKPIVQNAHAQLDALITDAHTGSLDHPVDLALMLAAEGAPQALLALVTHG